MYMWNTNNNNFSIEIIDINLFRIINNNLFVGQIQEGFLL